jgi:hypothetical protein
VSCQGRVTKQLKTATFRGNHGCFWLEFVPRLVRNHKFCRRRAAALAATFAPGVREITSQRWNLRVFSTVSERALSAIVLTVLPPQANLWS